MCSITLFRKSCRLRHNEEKCDTLGQDPEDKLIRRRRFASWIPKATDIYTACAIITAFAGLQWLRERPSLFRLYVNCLSYISRISQNGT